MFTPQFISWLGWKNISILDALLFSDEEYRKLYCRTDKYEIAVQTIEEHKAYVIYKKIKIKVIAYL